MHHKNDCVNFNYNYLNLILVDFLPFGPILCWRRGSSGGGGDRGIRRLSFDGGLAASASRPRPHTSTYVVCEEKKRGATKESSEVHVAFSRTVNHNLKSQM